MKLLIAQGVWRRAFYTSVINTEDFQGRELWN